MACDGPSRRRSTSVSGWFGETGTGHRDGLRVLVALGHLQHLFPQRTRVAPFTGTIERLRKLKVRAVVLGIPLQDLAKLNSGCLRVARRVEGFQTRLHQDFVGLGFGTGRAQEHDGKDSWE